MARKTCVWYAFSVNIQRYRKELFVSNKANSIFDRFAYSEAKRGTLRIEN